MNTSIINSKSNKKVVAKQGASRLKKTILSSALSFTIVLGSNQNGFCMKQNNVNKSTNNTQKVVLHNQDKDNNQIDSSSNTQYINCFLEEISPYQVTNKERIVKLILPYLEVKYLHKMAALNKQTSEDIFKNWRGYCNNDNIEVEYHKDRQMKSIFITNLKNSFYEALLASRLFFNIIGSNRCLRMEKLDLNSNNIDDDRLMELTGKISKVNGFPRLELLDLSENQISDTGISKLLAFIQPDMFPKLKTLVINGIAIKDNSAAKLLDTIKINKNLENVSFDHYDIRDPETLSELASARLDNTKVKDKSLPDLIESYDSKAKPDIKITDDSIKINHLGTLTPAQKTEVLLQLCARMRRGDYNNVTELDLSENFLTSAELMLLHHSIDNLPNLKILNLACNEIGHVYIGDKVFIKFLDKLNDLTELEFLNISATYIGNEACPKLEKLFNDHPNLQKLDAAGCNLEYKYVQRINSLKEFKALCLQIKDNPDLISELDLSNKHLPDDDMKKLAEEISKAGGLKNLQKINLSGNVLNSEIDILSDLIKKGMFEKLKILDLSHNNIGEGFSKLIESLRHLPTLHTLDLRNNSMDDVMGQKFVNELQNGLDIKNLYLFQNNLNLRPFKLYNKTEQLEYYRDEEAVAFFYLKDYMTAQRKYKNFQRFKGIICDIYGPEVMENVMQSIKNNLLDHANMQKINPELDPLGLSNLLNRNDIKLNILIFNVLKHLDNDNNLYLGLQILMDADIDIQKSNLGAIYGQHERNKNLRKIIYKAILPDNDCSQ